MSPESMVDSEFEMDHYLFMIAKLIKEQCINPHAVRIKFVIHTVHGTIYFVYG